MFLFGFRNGDLHSYAYGNVQPLQVGRFSSRIANGVSHLCDSSAVYESTASHDNCRRWPPISASVLVARSVVCANSRESARKKLRSDADFTAPTTAESSAACGTCRSSTSKRLPKGWGSTCGICLAGSDTRALVESHALACAVVRRSRRLECHHPKRARPKDFLRAQLSPLLSPFLN